ncbi:MAG: helix-turn-helix domain-containing protein [Armatimonadota bacterium]
MPNSKIQALKAQGTLNPHPELVTDELFVTNDFFDPNDLAQVKYEMLRRVHVDGMLPGKAAKAFGFSRMSFYNTQAAFARESLSGLLPKKRGPKHPHKLGEEVQAFLAENVSEDKPLRAGLLSQMVQERFGVRVHPRSIQRVLAQKKGQ